MVRIPPFLQTLAKTAVKNKLPLIVGISIFSLNIETLALAFPANIAWDVPLVAGESYQLEVARDSGFATPVATVRVRGNGFLWDAPSEGVYHWRIIQAPFRPPTSTQKVDDASTFVSGSFVIVDPAAQRDKPARLTWEPVVGADRYKIYVMPAQGPDTTMVTTGTVLFVPKLTASAMLTVVPYSGNVRTGRDFHLLPSLKFDDGRPPAPPKAPPPPPETTVAVVAPPPGPELPPPPPRPLVYGLWLLGVGGSEAIKTSRGTPAATELNSTKATGGLGASLWLNPLSWIVVSGMVDYHEHQDGAVKQQGSASSGGNLALSTTRYTADLAVGLNILDLWDVRGQVLTISVLGATMQVPSLPEEAVAAAAWQRLAVSTFGGGASYGYLGDRFGLRLEGGYSGESSVSASYVFGRLVAEYYPVELLALQLGAFGRQLGAKPCSKTGAACAASGPAVTSVQEAGAFAGVGVVFR